MGVAGAGTDVEAVGKVDERFLEGFLLARAHSCASALSSAYALCAANELLTLLFRNHAFSQEVEKVSKVKIFSEVGAEGGERAPGPPGGTS